MTLGQICFLDVTNTQRTTSINEVVSCVALELFAGNLLNYTAAGIEWISFSDDAYVEYLPGTRQVFFTQPEQRLDVNISPSSLPGLTCKEVLAVYLRQEDPHCRRAFTIPAPLFVTFEGARIIPAIGEELAAAYGALIGRNTTFQSGRILTP